jgi:hypothetical protein
LRFGKSPKGDPVKDLLEVWNMRRREDREKESTRREFTKLLESRFTTKHANFGARVVGLALNDLARAALARERDAPDAADLEHGKHGGY